MIKANTGSYRLRALRLLACSTVAILVVMAQAPTSSRSLVAPYRPFAQQGKDVDSPEAIKLATVLVSVPVTVTDHDGHAVSGLKRELFRIYEDEVEQPISFFNDEDAPASVGIVFDTSGSMSDGKIIQAREALARFIQTSHSEDEYFVIGFNSTASLLLDGTRDADVVLDQFKNVHPHGQTALYDALYLAIEKVCRGSYQKRAIILISDGADNHSRHDFRELCRRLQEADVAVYAIGIGGPVLRGLGYNEQMAHPDMERLASISGGRAFWPGSRSEMDNVFERIALELRRQYSIGYFPSNYVADGKWHRIKVILAVPRGLPRLIVRSREGYYAVKNQLHSSR